MSVTYGIRDDDYINTIWAIAESRYCSEFVVGLTAQPIRRRQLAYWNAVKLEYEHLIAIADKLNAHDAKALERHLQEEIRKRVDTVPALTKYNPERLKDVYRGSLGGSKLDPLTKSWSVYMAWREAPRTTS